MLRNSHKSNLKSLTGAMGLSVLAFYSIQGGLFAAPKKAAPAATAVAGPAGTIRGKVIDSANGEPMIGVTAVVKELNLFAVTDIDGSYVIANVPQGAQTVTYQIQGYQTAATQVNVAPGKAARANVTMNYQVSKEVVVTAKRMDNTAASLLSKQKKAAAAQDAISAEQINKSPDNDAADAAKRVTGLSIVGGQNVFIRGMSDRYSVVLVNGALVPSPIPTRRVVPLDIFPVSLLDNMTVVKSYLAKYPGEFGAGVIDIETRDYPEQKELKLGVTVGGNTQTTFQTFGTYSGGKLDGLGYDDGTRSIPGQITNAKVSPEFAGTGFSNTQRIAIAQQFSNSWSRRDTSGLPAGRMSVSFGNTYEIGQNEKLGVLASGFIQESSQSIKGVFKRYLADKSLAADYRYEDFNYSTTKTAQLSLTYASSKRNKFKLNTFYTQKSSDTTRQNIGQYDYSSNGTKTILAFSEASLIFNQLKGEHKLEFLDSEIDWYLNASVALRNQPDTRATRYTKDGLFEQSRNMTRYFNNHNENLFQGGAAFHTPFQQWSGLKAKFTVGGDASYRYRTTKSRRFTHDLQSIPNLALSAEDIFRQGQPMTSEVTGTSLAEGLDAYDASLQIFAGYTQLDMPIIPRLRFIPGVRVENWKQRADAFNIFDSSLKDKSQLTATNVMSTANLVYTPVDDLNIRLGGSQTINRPDFIEAANFRLFDDLVTGALIKGNPNLKAATITSGDLRVEYFPGVAEVIAISGFYKEISNPIEAAVGALADDLQFTYINQNKAKLFGGEIEARKNLGFISGFLKPFSILSNATLVQSEIEFNPDITTVETNKRRPLQGQSPWLLNAGLYYDNEKTGTSVAGLYNVFGRRIVQVGVNGLPNTYEESYGTLDLIVKQKIGRAVDLKIAAANLLNPEITQNQGTDDKLLVESYRRGINISVGVTYSLWAAQQEESNTEIEKVSKGESK
jgi:outer membrane receptor for ferrienterochelin and colicin